MSANAIYDVTDALRLRLEQAVGVGEVYVGPPVVADVGDRRACLFLFHLEPNRDLRNADHLVTRASDPTGPLVTTNALALDLRFLLSVFRKAGNGGQADHNELLTLGLAMQALQIDPNLSGALVPGQEVRLTLEPYPIDEVNRVWALFPDTSYRTSVVYLATPVFVTAEPGPDGRRVQERTLRAGPGSRSLPVGAELLEGPP